MGKKDVVKVEANLAIRPDHIPEKPEGTEGLQEYITPARVKVIQKQASDELLEQFGVGDICISAGSEFELLSAMGVNSKGRPTGKSKGFLFTPIFFFAEYCTWNPLGKTPAILARTFDKTNPIALKAKDFNMMEEPHPEFKDLKIRHVEHMNFVILIPEVDEPIILSFQRGSHKYGRGLANLIKQRHAPIYGCVFQALPISDENELGSWWSLEITNPAIDDSSPWVSKECIGKTKALYEQYQKYYSHAKMQVAYEEPITTSDEF